MIEVQLVKGPTIVGDRDPGEQGPPCYELDVCLSAEAYHTLSRAVAALEAGHPARRLVGMIDRAVASRGWPLPRDLVTRGWNGPTGRPE